MKAIIEQPLPHSPKELPCLSHEQKRDLIKSCIEQYAVGKDFWMTFTDIAESTGMPVKDVIRTMKNSESCFMQSSWRMRDGQLMVTVRALYEERTSLFEKILAAFAGQRD